MAFFNEAWFIHAVSENVTQLAQQKRSKTGGSTRVKDGVVGKTWPFNRIGVVEMQPVARDSGTVYANPPQSKRRAQLSDFALAVLIDQFDDVRTLTSPESEFAQILAYGRNRKIDDFALTAALAAAVTVDEAGETTGTQVLPVSGGPAGIGQVIVNGSTGLTLAKIILAAELMNAQDVDEEDRYFYYSAQGMSDLLANTVATSADYSTIQALMRGGFPADQTWMGFHWRMTTRLAKTGNIRSCIAWQKNAIGVAFGLVQDVETGRDPSHWNNPFCMIKLSGGGCRVDDVGVVQIDIDESV